jgi:predicted ATP-dependent endonuclease of OLD family
MYIQSVKMNNFKSIGETDNDVIFEPRITAVIGKNESGKSNVLEGLSHISFNGKMNSAFANDNINRNNGSDAVIEYTIALKPNAQEQESFGITSDTQIIINKDSYLATGGILEYYNNNVREYFIALAEALDGNPFQLSAQDQGSFRTYVMDLQQENSLDIRRINAAFSFFETHISRAKPVEKAIIVDVLSNSKAKWNLVLSLLPGIFYRNTDKVLKTRYTLEEVKKELKAPASYPNSLLPDLVKLIQIANKDFITAVQAGGTGLRTSIRKRIKRNIKKIINDEFKDFYTTESILLDVDFDSNVVIFSVQSGEGETLLLSERSNGLRWYLNTFIDATAHGISQTNAIYLFDEPGISLHVNAQKELLNLFEHLVDKGNQVIYTTHSPYMLNLQDDGIHRIRAIDKDSEGFTHIYKTAYDANISPRNQQDTLAPIIAALGMTIYDTVGPANNKLNVVTEGVSDYIYLHTMAKLLEIDMTAINIIASFGVTNSLNICNILYGWKCPFVAIFDFDKEGVERGGEKMRNSLLYEMGKQYLYIKNIEQRSIELKEYNDSPYMIEDIFGRDTLADFVKQEGLSNNATEIGKTLLAKLFCNALEDGSYCVNKECLNRFRNLFSRILDVLSWYNS